MSNLGPAPLLMTRKISPSVEPRSHLSSVRSEGCVFSGAIGPLPFASAPWQKRQFFWNSACPALIDSGDVATGFFIFLPSGLPPGFCAPACAVITATQASASTGIEVVKMRGIRKSSPWAGGFYAISFHDALVVWSWGHDDRDFLVRHQRPVVRAAAEHVSAWLAEGDMDRHFAVLWQFRRRPERRPWGIRAGAGILPRLDLRGIERHVAGPPIHEPGHVQPEVLPDRDPRRRRHRR